MKNLVSERVKNKREREGVVLDSSLYIFFSAGIGVEATTLKERIRKPQFFNNRLLLFSEHRNYG
ncbi:MAG: hypothetical protein U9O90_08945 [Euryarchaeota archaeon]|nr:hypothetical protein [Euryarchaeota archaeon]